jgi:uncharacterized RDD family membrane protein YckC
LTDKFLKGIGAGVIGILIIILCAFLTGWIVMLLWNWLMPMLFGLKTITYIEGWGITFLTGMLFRGTTTVSSKD